MHSLLLEIDNGSADAMCDLGIELLEVSRRASAVGMVQRHGLILLERAANATPPHAKALHTLGTFYIQDKQQIEKGNAFLEKARALGY